MGSEGAPSAVSSKYGPSAAANNGGDSGGVGGGIRITQEMSVPPNMVGLIIGRAGENLKKIERESGCKVQINNTGQDGSGGSSFATITGLENEVKEAKKLIQELMDTKSSGASTGIGGPGGLFGGGPSGPSSGSDNRPLPPGHSLYPMEVPSNKVGLVIGKGGETIKMLQEQSGAKVVVVQDAMTDRSAPMRIVNITGSQDSIDVAKTLINDVILPKGPGGMGGGGGGYNSGAYQNQQYGNMSEDIKVPNDKVGLVIGRGGETIKYIQSTFQVKVQIEPAPDANNVRAMKVIGNNQGDISNAIGMIMEKTGGGGGGGMNRPGGDISSSGGGISANANPYAASYGYGYGNMNSFATPAPAPGYDYSQYWGDPSQASGYQYDPSMYYAQQQGQTPFYPTPTQGDPSAMAAPTPDGSGASTDPAANAAAWEAYYAYYAQYASSAGAGGPGADGSTGTETETSASTTAATTDAASTDSASIPAPSAQ